MRLAITLPNVVGYETDRKEETLPGRITRFHELDFPTQNRGEHVNDPKNWPKRTLPSGGTATFSNSNFGATFCPNGKISKLEVICTVFFETCFAKEKEVFYEISRNNGRISSRLHRRTMGGKSRALPALVSESNRMLHFH